MKTNKRVLFTVVMVLASLTTSTVFASSDTYRDTLAIEFAPCELAELAYIDLVPVESLEDECLAAYNEIAERDIDLGFLDSASAGDGGALLETLLASDTGRSVSYAWTADLTGQTEREIDAGFIPVYRPVEATIDLVASAEREIDAGFGNAARAGIAVEIPAASTYAYGVSLVDWSGEATALLEREIDAGLFIR